MSEIGAMVIRLTAETAQFREDLGKVKSQLGEVGDSSGKAGDAVDVSMRDSAGSVRLLTHELGIPLPRELSRLIATIPGVGAAFSTMLPIIGVIAAIAAIAKLVEMHEKAVQAMRDATTASAAFKVKEQDLVLSLKDANLALEDEILKLEKRPSANRLALAIDDVKRKTDELMSTFATDFKKMDDDVNTYTNSWIQDFKDYFAASSGKVAAGSMQEQTDAFANLAAARQKLQAAESQQASIDPKTHLDEWRVATGQVATEAGHVQAAFDRARAAVLALHSDGNTLTEEFTRGAIAAKTEWQAMDEEIKNMGLSVKKVATEDLSAFTKWHDDEMHRLNEWAAKYRESTEKIGEERIDMERAVAGMMAEEYRKQLEAAQKQAEANSKLAASYAEIGEAKAKADAAGQKAQIQGQASLGIISKQQEARMLLAIDQKELADYKTNLAAKLQALKDYAAQASSDGVAAQTAADESKGTSQQDATQAAANQAKIAATQAQILYNNAVKQGVTDTQQLNDKLTQQNTQLQKLNPSFQQIIGQMRNELPSAALQMQNSMTKAFDGVSQGIAKTLVEGKNLGSEMRVVVRQMAEQWIEYAIKRMLMDRLVTGSHITGNATQAASDKTTGAMSQLAAAKAGAAKAYQAMAGIPIIGPELGAIAGALAFATMMAFEKGGKIPGAGAVPIVGHGGETVVTKALTDRVERSESHSMTNNGGATHVHANFSPQVHAMDAEGVDRVLTKHGALFQRHLASTIRRMNR